MYDGSVNKGGSWVSMKDHSGVSIKKGPGVTVGSVNEGGSCVNEGITVGCQ